MDLFVNGSWVLRPRLLAVAFAALFLIGCSSGSEGESASGNPNMPSGNPTGSAGGNGSMTALIDGQPWTAGQGPAGCRLGAEVQNGAAGICGTDGRHQVGLGVRALVGRYPLGVGASGIDAAFLIDLTSLGSWGPTRLQGSGEIVVTSVSATNITGTFTFTAGPLSPPATGVRAVTNGQFNLRVCTTC